MRVGWLQDDPGYVGGAELTAQELRAAAPGGVEIIDCPPGEVTVDVDCSVVHNCMSYRPEEAPRGRVVRFIHDTRGPGPIDADRTENRIFYSPLHRERVGLGGRIIPAPIDTEAFKPTRQTKRNRSQGAVTIGTFGHPGKGQHLLLEWAMENGPLVIFGHGDFVPRGPGIDYRGPVEPDRVATTLWGFSTFVHLPTEVEAFGRGVVEAHFADCDLVVNRKVGALYWLEERPDALKTAAADFWEVALNG